MADHGTYVRHAHPGAPVELIRWSDGAVVYVTFHSDKEALTIAADLVTAVLANGKAKPEGT